MTATGGVVTVYPMLGRRARPWLWLVAALIALVAAGPAAAHPGAPPDGGGRAEQVDSAPAVVAPAAPVSDAAASSPVGAPASPGVSWPALLAVAALGTLAWRWPSRAALLALVLLLSVFAFEEGVHSVHHGFDPAKAASCVVAAVGGHLSATAVDGGAPGDIALGAADAASVPAPAEPTARFTSPDQGRAPPAPFA